MSDKLVKKVSILHSGVYTYQKEELGTLGLDTLEIPEMFKDATHFNVYRSAPVVVASAHLFVRLPVVVEHPSRLVDSYNAKDLMEGLTGDTVHVSYRNGEAYLDSTLTLVAEDAIRYYKQGYKEVSPGYLMSSRWVSTDTENYKGMPIHIIVTKINVVNHLALTVEGRGGPTACVLDSKGGGMFITDLFKSAKQLFTKDSVTTVSTLLSELCAEDITAEKAGHIIDKVVTAATIFPESEDKSAFLRFLEDLRFVAELNKDEVKVAVTTVASLYVKLDTAAKAEVTNIKETSMPEKTEPVAEPVKDTAVAPVAEPAATTDYAPGATGVAGPGAQKMVGDTGGFISELKALIAKYESTGDSKPQEEPKKEEPTKDSQPVTTDSKVVVAPAAVVEPAAALAPEAITATIATTDSKSKGIESFMDDFLK